MKLWSWLLGGGIVGLVLYEIFNKPQSNKGDVAQVGDNIRVSIATLPPNSLPAAFPQGMGLIDVKVDSADSSSVTGQVTGYYIQENLPPIAVSPNIRLHIPRSSIVTVIRDGQVIA